ncbi:conserved hypothetical protein [Ricinus communis]|uniref:Uncharacterized protein n=1 Tax=Ricinus communis TaxID=3988 RepID=B9TL57_RICCO|nr:conserved hypothetical protein [Ricinus communis]
MVVPPGGRLTGDQRRTTRSLVAIPCDGLAETCQVVGAGGDGKHTLAFRADRQVANACHGFAVDLPRHVTADDGAAMTGAVTHANQGFAHRFPSGPNVK